MDKLGSISLSSLNRSDNTDKLQCPDCQKVYKKPIFKINYHETDIINLKQQIEKFSQIKITATKTTSTDTKKTATGIATGTKKEKESGTYSKTTTINPKTKEKSPRTYSSSTRTSKRIV